MSRKRKHSKNFSPYTTYALADKGKVDPITHTSIPAESAVIEAKQWVDENKK